MNIWVKRKASSEGRPVCRRHDVEDARPRRSWRIHIQTLREIEFESERLFGIVVLADEDPSRAPAVHQLGENHFLVYLQITIYFLLISDIHVLISALVHRVFGSHLNFLLVITRSNRNILRSCCRILLQAESTHLRENIAAQLKTPEWWRLSLNELREHSWESPPLASLRFHRHSRHIKILNWEKRLLLRNQEFIVN